MQYLLYVDRATNQLRTSGQLVCPQSSSRARDGAVTMASILHLLNSSEITLYTCKSAHAWPMLTRRSSPTQATNTWYLNEPFLSPLENNILPIYPGSIHQACVRVGRRRLTAFTLRECQSQDADQLACQDR